jgi:hypothetical protein
MKKIAPLTFQGFMLMVCVACSQKAVASKVATIQKHKIELSEALVKASGGFAPGIGSGLTFHQKSDKGHLEFYAISDRGPNFSFDERKIISFNPSFSPIIAHVDVETGVRAYVKDFTSLKREGKPITGINPGQDGTDEILCDVHLNKLTTDFGLDTESLGLLKNGDFVVGDEYGPSINIVDHTTGNIIKRFTPGDGLPEILKDRQFNKGFESVAVAPNGKVYALLEGVLTLDAQSVKTAKLIRMVELDLEKNTTRMFAYPFDHAKYQDSSKVKVGDLSAIDNETFLLVEQGPATDGQFYSLIFKINIADATDITDKKHAPGQELEQGNLAALEAIKPVTKQLVFNPREHGWTEKKLEGLTVIDSNTIAITNDNDFAIEGCEDVGVQGSTHKILPKINSAKRETNLWIISFEEKM